MSTLFPKSRDSRSLFPSRPEEEFLVRCALGVPPEQSFLSSARFRESLDWDFLYEGLLEHRLMPLAFRYFSVFQPDIIPTGFMQRVRDSSNRMVRLNLALTAELSTFFDLLSSHGIPALAYKGPVLAAELYGNVSHRPFIDLDIVVRAQEVEKAKELFYANGCTPVYPRTPKQDSYALRSECSYQLKNRKGIFIELHWRVVPDHFSIPLDTDSFFDRARTVSVGGRPVATFSPEDLLLVLSIHGAKHLWHRLMWLTDIHQLLQRHPTLDWDSLFKRAQRSHVQRIVLLSLSLVKDLFQENLPEDVCGRISQDRSVSALSQQIRKRLALHIYGPPSFREMPLFLKMRERRWDQLLYSFRYGLVLATPTEMEWKRFPLPDRLSFLYYLIRPIRLAGKYLRKERFSVTKHGGSASHFGGELNKCAEGEI